MSLLFNGGRCIWAYIILKLKVGYLTFIEVLLGFYSVQAHGGASLMLTYSHAQISKEIQYFLTHSAVSFSIDLSWDPEIEHLSC